MKTDYSLIYTGVFSPTLSSVIAVFRLTAGNYCFFQITAKYTHLQSLLICSGLVSLGTQLFLDASVGFFNF